MASCDWLARDSLCKGSKVQAAKILVFQKTCFPTNKILIIIKRGAASSKRLRFCFFPRPKLPLTNSRYYHPLLPNSPLILRRIALRPFALIPAVFVLAGLFLVLWKIGASSPFSFCLLPRNRLSFSLPQPKISNPDVFHKPYFLISFLVQSHQNNKISIVRVFFCFGLFSSKRIGINHRHILRGHC